MTNEELSFRTKQALAAALKTALERKKLSKITVSELAEACQVNRKTFYYHFQDVYALFRWMLEQEAIDVVKNFDLVVDTEEALRFVMEYVDENKHLINGAFDSMGYEEIKRFFYNDLFCVFSPAFQAAQERSPIAGFSACGGPLLRHNSLPPHGDPRGAFLCHRT